MTEPAITILERRAGNVRILADLRTGEGVRQALGVEVYPAAVFYAPANWIEQHPREVAALAHAVRRTLDWMQKHSPEQIAAAMPMYSADGRMPEGGPQAVHQVLKVVLEKVRNARLDLRATYFNTP
ncbi:MAG: hypothetical protein HY235_13990 [Acidobacteria bacterium]|nr:hypothetical protein [Acidobacteriota bacterium]